MTQVVLTVLQIKLYWQVPIHFYIFYSYFHDTVRISSWNGECMAHKQISGPLRKSMSAPVLDSHLFFTTTL